MPNDQGNSYFVQVYTADQFGNLSLEEGTPFREIYQFGGGVITVVNNTNSSLINGVQTYNVLKTDQILLVETINGTWSGNITIQLPPAELEPGQILYIKKATNDGNSVIIAASTPASAALAGDVDLEQQNIDGTNTYTLISNGPIMSNITIAANGK